LLLSVIGCRQHFSLLLSVIACGLGRQGGDVGKTCVERQRGLRKRVARAPLEGGAHGDERLDPLVHQRFTLDTHDVQFAGARIQDAKRVVLFDVVLRSANFGLD